MGSIGGTDRFHRGPESERRYAWKCPSCGTQITTPFEQGCPSCGTGTPEQAARALAARLRADEQRADRNRGESLDTILDRVGRPERFADLPRMTVVTIARALVAYADTHRASGTQDELTDYEMHTLADQLMREDL